MAEAAGYVVQGRGSKFLSRAKRFVRHRNRSDATGAERAWVHGEADILEGGLWTHHVAKVIPARYDDTLKQTVITGEPIWYDQFIKDKNRQSER